MAYGVACYDESGNVVLSVTDRITRYGGQFDTGTGAGSLTVPMFSTGSPFISVRDTDPLNASSSPPEVSLSGNVISWSFDANGLNPRSVSVVYGVF